MNPEQTSKSKRPCDPFIDERNEYNRIFAFILLTVGLVHAPRNFSLAHQKQTV
jgi:hypothetical protein